jgi:hypothetical protein
MDSIEYKLNRLKTAWEEFTMGIMNSDLVKAGIDILTSFLEIINKSTKGLTGLGGSIAKIASILTVFKFSSKVFEKIKAPLTKFFMGIIVDAKKAGEDSGKAFKKGFDEAKKKTKSNE